MQRFKYVGGADEVEIPGVGSVKRGESIDVPPPFGDGLHGQADWEHQPAKATKQTKSEES